MAEEIAKNSQYQYTGNSNLVIENRRRGGKDEPSGDPETLYGKIDPKEFGSKALREKVNAQEKERHRSSDAVQEKKKRRREEAALKKAYGYNSVLAATDDLEDIIYRPKTKETQSIYEMMLSLVQRQLGDLSPDELRSATDFVLETLKNDNLKDNDKQTQIKGLIPNINDEVFTQLLSLSKKLNDYKAEGAEEEKDDNIDGEIGVAVVFNEDEEDDMEIDEEEDEEEGEYDVPMDIKLANDIAQEAIESVEVEEKIESKKSKKEHEFESIQPYDIDRHWVLRLVKKYYSDEYMASQKTEEMMEILNKEASHREYENDLMAVTEFDHYNLVNMLVKNRDVIIWTLRLKEAGEDTQERKELEAEMTEKGLDHILKSLESDRSNKKGLGDLENRGANGNADRENVESQNDNLAPKQKIDLDMLAFNQGGHLMSNKKCLLPAGSTKTTHKGYEEYSVPAPESRPLGSNERLVPISDLPKWSQTSFGTTNSLNRVQSRVFPCAFEKLENMLLCAPTGAGKTNCAMLTILREIQENYNFETNSVNLDNFKIVYIAPMKALVQEMVTGFSKRLEYLNIKVAELTGDTQLTKTQIAETQIIVTTPEKWDVITRKATDRSYTNLVRLIIIDEIHLLHDDRGPVLESLVARTLRYSEENQERVRLVGLSATLPNYEDVATFLRVKKENLFFFDSSYRPCPLKQQFIGITEKKAIKRFQTMNEVAYKKILEQAGQNQSLIFVHSRKETARTAQSLRDMALDAGTLAEFIPNESSKEILNRKAEEINDPTLKDLLPCGFAIHHAGMTKADRTLVEDLFRDGHIQVLCSTATLAWGVNLPAHTVIIKGTQIYNPEKGRWAELSPQDVLQMLGRAGRPQYDTFGEGIIITTHNEIQYYLSLLNAQLPIESQFISKLADNLNAEIVLGTVRTREEAVHWLGYTYLYVRMLRNGSLYGIANHEQEEDPYLRQKRVDLIHSAANILDSCQLIKYDRRSGKLQGTELGRIASHYYITHKSMATYNQHLKPYMNYIELFRAFALSEEFKLIPVREEEKLEVARLLERVPIPIKENADEPAAKVSVLLQAYISQLNLEGFALMSDMVYITQSASRILRAIFEMCLRRGWAQLSRLALDLCKIVDHRCWLSMSPLRQFYTLTPDLIRKIERKDFPWERYFDLDAAQLGQLVGVPRAGKYIHNYVHMFPKLKLECHVQPITRSLLMFDLTIIPDFIWDNNHHGSAQQFWVIVEDCDGTTILYNESFVLKEQYSQDPHYLSFTVPLYDPLPPNYFVSVISDRWLHSEARQAVSFRHLILPDKYPPHTELYDYEPLPVGSLKESHQHLYNEWIKYFNPIQTQTNHVLYTTDDNAFVGAPSGSGKTICGEFAMLRLWSKSVTKEQPINRVVYIASNQDVIDEKYNYWKNRFNHLNKTVVSLTGEASADLKLIEGADLILATPTQWDLISRRWKQRKNVQTIGLFLMDDLHMVGSSNGPTYEVIVSRMRYIASQTKYKTRFVGLSAPLANAFDIAVWIGAPTSAVFSFHPSDRPVQIDIHIQSYSISHYPSRMLAMARPTYLAAKKYAEKDTTIVFVSSRRQCRLTAGELAALQGASKDNYGFLGCSKEEIQSAIEKIEDQSLAQLLTSGIGYYHEALSKNDLIIIKKLFEVKAIRVLVASKDSCWSMGNMLSQLVVIMGAQYYEGKEHRYIDYPLTDMLKMIGRAAKPFSGISGRVVLMCQPNKKEYFKKFINEGLPIESHLDHMLHDHFNSEIVTKSIENKQDAVDFLTWTFLYRRLIKNPNYYGLEGISQQHLSDHLTELVEKTMDELALAQCITIEDEVIVSPLNLGMIAGYYNIRYDTLDLISRSLTADTKLKGLLEIISAASEFSDIPMRHQENIVLSKLYTQLPVKLINPDMRKISTKVHLLLQAHFCRTQLPPDMTSDQISILRKIIPLLQATVDVTSSSGWLNPALAAMELAQMSVQAQWDRDSALKQIPYFNNERIELAKKLQVETVFDLMEMDNEREEILKGLTTSQINKVALFCNKYPSIKVEYQFITSPDEMISNEYSKLQVLLEREEEVNDTSVIANYFPMKKDEAYWLVLGDPKYKQLLGIKRFTMGNQLKLILNVLIPPPIGKRELELYLIPDCYIGSDQFFELKVNLLQGNDDEEDDEEEEDSDME
ncbi:Sec63-domain-containing protein [Neoconidiobolus thromboides FSU 785]|nr:Sec63-domain-containing protein [Neoconidiobolus thromboides FSU 785]